MKNNTFAPRRWLARIAAFAAVTAAVLLPAASPTLAADIDIFAGNAPTGANAPHLLFVIDTGASFSANNNDFRCNISSSGVVKVDGTGANADFTELDKTNGGVEQCALYTVIKALGSNSQTVRVGIMLFNGNQAAYDPTTGTFNTASCVGGGGGCLVVPFTTIDNTSSTATARANLLNYIRNWETSGNGNYNIKSPANRGDGAAMQEAWAYFFGKTGMSGRNYASIAPGSGCASKNVVFLGNAYNTQASPKDTTNSSLSPAMALLRSTSIDNSAKWADPAPTSTHTASITGTYSAMNCGGSLVSGTVPTDEGKGAYANNWARYMRDQGVVTYSVGLTGTSCDTTYVAQLTKMGSSEVGGGKYFATNNYDELVTALTTIFSEILAVNTAFASAALPASVNTQGLYLNQVFLGMFRPADDFLPRWNGNLKQYKMALVSDDLQLQDAANQDAINTGTGFITQCARSFWTPSEKDSYWTNFPSGNCTESGAKVSNSPDGDVVEKGAQAYMLRSIAPSARVVKTCGTSMSTCSSLGDFTTSALTGVADSVFGATSSTEKNTLIDWARGTNVDGELTLATTVMRPSAHGDVVHSRPVAVNHGTDSSPAIVVYYGGNDGLLRAVNGSRSSPYTTSGTTYAAGAELWSFMPPEFYSRIKRLRQNAVSGRISYPGSGGGSAKDYGIDGPITAFQGTVGGSAKTYIYATMRRGGRSVYAFDVTTPGAPSLLWKRGCFDLTSDADCSNTALQSIGQTWSAPKAMYAEGYGGGTSPLIIMGGGYDACEDYDAGSTGGKNHNCVSGGGATEPSGVTKGNRIYVLDAASGTVVQTFKTKRAVVADVTLVRDSNGRATLGYTADMGGNVYRLSFTGASQSNWTITQIAALGCDTPSGCTDSVANRKFMFAPSVISVGTSQYALMLGSGDREKPVSSYASSRGVTNYFFRIVDDVSSATWLTAENTACGGNYICLASLYPITTAATPTDTQLATKPKGWYVGLSSSEQVVTQAITVFGVVTFSTHMPSTGSSTQCTPDLGTTRVYNVSYKTAQGVVNGALSDTRYQPVAGNGLPPSPIAGRVRLDDGSIQPFCIGCSADSPERPKKPTGFSTVVTPKGRMYWMIEKKP
jgi:type IV pilus assembly protein PilY1